MPNDLTQDGIGNIGLQGISGPTVNITQILGKSIQYQDLREQLDTNEKLLALIPEDDLGERLKVGKKVNQFKEQIRQFREDVLRLAEQFEKIEINSERIKQAKVFFDKGEIGEARAILEADIEQIQDEHLHLIRQREKFDNEILPQLKNNSDEFYILALSKQTDYPDQDWFENTCTYFEKSIAAFPTKFNVFQYALFLQKHNYFLKAVNYYQKFLTDFSASIELRERAMTLNNLGVLHTDKNEYEDALGEYEEALEIRRKLAAENPQVYMIMVAQTCYNLAIFHKKFKNDKESSVKMMIEVVSILLPVAEFVPYTQPYLQKSIDFLRNCDLNDEDIARLVSEKLQDEKD